MHSTLFGKHITIGITGSIAAYKIYALIRELKLAGAEVQVVLSQSAKHFVSEMVLQSLSGNKVLSELFSCEDELAMSHISVAKNTDIFVIAPATADFIAKVAHGMAGDLLLTTILATTKPILIAPAMNVNMWNNKATQANIALLKERGLNIIPPASGVQACGDEGMGRMVEIEEIYQHIETFLFAPKLLLGKKIVITAGATLEKIDPVRYISNFSSGKMGFALAKIAHLMGADVTLISGKTNLQPPLGIDFHAIESTDDMLNAVKQCISEADVFIASAAASDYKPLKYAQNKIKKTSQSLNIELQRNEDIISFVSNLSNRPFCVGFAAETENLQKNAILKLNKKNLDIVVANEVINGFPFGEDENKVTVFGKQGSLYQSEKISKEEISIEIFKLVAKNLCEETASSKLNDVV